MLDLLLGSDAAANIANVVRAEDVNAPDHCDLEVVAGLRRMRLHRELTEARMQDAFLDYLDLDVTFHVSRPLLERVFSLRHNFSPYDAAYVALAELLEAPLITTDARLARAARSHTDLTVLPEASRREP